MSRYIPQHVKNQVVMRDRNRCTGCGGRGSLRSPLQFHHVIPWHISKSHALGNLRLLCEKCHLSVHRKQALAS